MNKVFIIFIAFLLSSCREEIIAPGNPAGNLNQPVKEQFQNSYSFVMNAGNITYNLYDYMKFDNARTQIYISVLDYSSGSADVSLLSQYKHIIFNRKAESDITGEFKRLNNEIPEAIIINFQDFTGKIKITVSRY